MNLSPLEQQTAAKPSRKSSPLLAASERKKIAENKPAVSRQFTLLENRVDELNQQIHDLQSEKDWQDEINQALSGRLSAIIDVVPAGIVVLDAAGRITETNASAKQLLQCTLIGQLWRDVSQVCFKRRIDDGHEISTVAGKRLSVSTRSLGDDQQGQIILLSDQTETRRLQSLVSHQQRLSALGQMVSAMAHQLRTPLSAALLYVSHLCDQSLNEIQRQKFSEKCRSRLQHMERQIQDMLLFVKGELPLNDQITRDRFVIELKEALEAPIAQHRATLNLSTSGTNFLLRCNRDALVNAVLNLVNNSLQAYENDSNQKHEYVIDLVVDFDNKNLNIKVRDYGPGIQPNLLDKLNEPFVTTKAQGTGLGLAVVRAVAQAHQGTFSISPLQTGVCMTLQLPAVNTVIAEQSQDI